MFKQLAGNRDMWKVPSLANNVAAVAECVLCLLVDPASRLATPAGSRRTGWPSAGVPCRLGSGTQGRGADKLKAN